jgi:hypothetical protein
VCACFVAVVVVVVVVVAVVDYERSSVSPFLDNMFILLLESCGEKLSVLDNNIIYICFVS